MYTLKCEKRWSRHSWVNHGPFWNGFRNSLRDLDLHGIRGREDAGGGGGWAGKEGMRKFEGKDAKRHPEADLARAEGVFCPSSSLKHVHGQL